MKNPALKTAGAVFLLVAVLHLARFLFKLKILVGNYEVPFWWSALGFLIAFSLGIWMFRASK